jgi:hypothetical protein
LPQERATYKNTHQAVPSSKAQNHLSEALKKKFLLEWKPVFAMMGEAPNLTIPEGTSPLDPKFIQESFDKGTEYLKTRAS